jgi:hypothetical protein
MSTTLRTHPWWVAGLAALAAAAATVLVLALAGAFDSPRPTAPEATPIVVVHPTSGGDTKGDLFAGPGSSGLVGDTKGDVGTSAQGQELAYQAGTGAGAGH